MGRSVLESARIALRRRQFAKVITLLEPNMELYRENFEFYFVLGTACLYVGDVGNANLYYERARSIKLLDTKLMLGQAAIFLRRGDTDRALEYYLEILNNEPGNETAKDAMDFIRVNGDFNVITEWVDSGKIEKFYPPLGLNPDTVAKCILCGVAAGVVLAAVIAIIPLNRKKPEMPRANLEKLMLTSSEKAHPQEQDLTGTNVTYILDSAEVRKSYEKAMECFQERRDNAAQVEINRILNSNAAFSIKQKAVALMAYLSSPTFDSLKDNYTYAQVCKEPALYVDCWVKWNGRVSNVQTLENGLWRADLLVGYEDMKTVEGIVPVSYDPAPQPPVDGERAVQVLAQIKKDGDNLVLKGKSVYQPLQGKSLPKE